MFLASTTTQCVGTMSQSTPCISSNNDVSERFVGSSLRIVLAPIAPFFVPTHQIPVPRSLSLIQSLPRRQSGMFPCQDLEQDGFCNRNNLLRAISVTRCPEQCDATRSTCPSRDTKCRVCHHAWPDRRDRSDSRFATILRDISKSSQLFANCPNWPLLAELCRGEVTPSGIFAFIFCATVMIEGSLSQRTLNLPTNKLYTKSATELARQSVAPLVSDAITHTHPVLESTSARSVPDRHRLYHRQLGPFVFS